MNHRKNNANTYFGNKSTLLFVYTKRRKQMRKMNQNKSERNDETNKITAKKLYAQHLK